MANALQITARPAKGFRRAGVHHPAGPIVHPAGRFTPEQVAALKAEPNLIVAELAAAQGAASGEAEGASPKRGR